MAPGFCDMVTVLAGVKGRFALISIALIIITGIGIGSLVIVIIPGGCEAGMVPGSKLRFYLDDGTKVKGQPSHGGCDFALLCQLSEFENVND